MIGLLAYATMELAGNKKVPFVQCTNDTSQLG